MPTEPTGRIVRRPRWMEFLDSSAEFRAFDAMGELSGPGRSPGSESSARRRHREDASAAFDYNVKSELNFASEFSSLGEAPRRGGKLARLLESRRASRLLALGRRPGDRAARATSTYDGCFVKSELTFASSRQEENEEEQGEEERALCRSPGRSTSSRPSSGSASGEERAAAEPRPRLPGLPEPPARIPSLLERRVEPPPPPPPPGRPRPREFCRRCDVPYRQAHACPESPARRAAAALREGSRRGRMLEAARRARPARGPLGLGAVMAQLRGDAGLQPVMVIMPGATVYFGR